MNQEQKLFLAVWGEGYTEQGEKSLTLDQITEDNGWFPENIEAIADSQVGDIVDCSCITAQLYVLRLQ